MRRVIFTLQSTSKCTRTALKLLLESLQLWFMAEPVEVIAGDLSHIVLYKQGKTMLNDKYLEHI